jgi:hypothetical protein
MSRKFFILFSLVLTFFSQPLFDNKANAQTNNPRYFNERFVVQALLTIPAAEATYSATTGSGTYGSMADLLAANFIDPALASGDKYGYSFVLVVIPRTTTTPERFYVTATPRLYPKSGRTSFFIDESGEMRGADKNGAAATVSDPIIDSCARSGFSNEYCTIRDLRTLHGAQMTYQSTFGAGTFGNLSQLYAANLIRQSMASGTNHGYSTICTAVLPTATMPATFKISATPATYGVTGVRSFFIDESGVLRGADKRGEPADENDPPIEN